MDADRSRANAAPRLCAAAALCVAGALPGTASAQSLLDLRQMSISQLSEIDVSSVTKSTQRLSDAAAAIYVIRHEDIVRSGATTIPQILRLAPNLQVARVSASQYVITARGMSGNDAAQNFSNKLLVLIDGRSVYTPVYSGVYWDMQDVLPADIDRIEVISGPGATLWGANAVNGVINIITRAAADTQGGLVDVTAGALERSGGLRYGGALGSAATYRLYAHGNQSDALQTAAGASAQDEFWRAQGGFRIDWSPSDRDKVTLQGDIYQGIRGQAGAADERIAGRNLLARWNRTGSDGSDLQVQAYYDRTSRTTLNAGGHLALDTYDVDLQHSFALGGWNSIVWGGGARATRYWIHGKNGLAFDPSSDTLLLANAFVQDTIAIDPRLNLTLGFKLEDDPYSGIAPLPSVRIGWKPDPAVLLWGAVSRAIRSPTPFDRDVVETVGTTVFVGRSPGFEAEKLTAYELGTRLQPLSRLSFSVSGFYHRYDDLRSIEITPVTFLPLIWGNGLEGDSYGIESWADFELLAWWKLSASFSFLHGKYMFKPGASGLLGVSQVGSDPKHQASLRSSMNLGKYLTLDADLRHIGPRPDPYLPGYFELNGRVAWNLSARASLIVSGFNLLHASHRELALGTPIPRQVVAGLQLRFWRDRDCSLRGAQRCYS
ncbi:N/A [soil metagenome]